MRKPALLLLPLLAAALALAVLPAVATAASAPSQRPQLAPAAIKGRIVDAESGDPLPYTNVFISGTNIGTMAFNDGDYILRLPAGTYTIKASYISYAVGSQTVTLQPGELKVLDFRLEVQAIYVDPIMVDAERKLIEVERTGSSHFITAAQMEAMPLDDVVDMLAHKPGVTIYDNEVHIRGGRSEDTQFIIDGMSVNDPLAGGGYGYQIDPSIINEIEVMTGGFNAEYGQAVSGVVNVSTKEGSDRLSGKISLKRDYALQPVDKRQPVGWDRLTVFDEPQNIDVLKVSLSGPDPLGAALRAAGLGLPGKQYLLLSGSVDLRDGYLPIYSRREELRTPLYDAPWLSPRENNEWNGLAKWSWHLTPRHKLNVTASRQLSISQGFDLPGEGYPRPFLEGGDGAGLDRYLVFTSENILTQLYWRQVLGEESWYEVQFGRNFNRLHANVNGDDDFTGYQLIDSPPLPAGQAFGGADRWHDHYSESWTAKADYSFMKDTNNRFKTGVELSFTEMQLVDLQSSLGRPPPGKLGIQEDIFLAHPVVGAAYFQDTIDYHGLIVNAGLRADFFAPGREVEEVMADYDEYLFIYPEMAAEFADETIDVLGRSWKMRLSPRLGMSFPVTERDKFFFNYGHFSQWPRFAYVYPQLQAKTATKVQLLGNPNLDPKVTVEYETGLQHEFEGLWSLGLTFFNRDIYGYAKSVQLGAVDIGADETPDPNDSGTVTIEPVRYFNGDSARSLGVELSLIKRTTRWVSGSASLEWQKSTGTNSRAEEAYLQAIYDEAYTPTASIGGLQRTPLLWDKPLAFSLNVDVTVGDKDRPAWGLPVPHLSGRFPFLGLRYLELGGRMPADWSANLLARIESGQRYTPRIYRGPGEYVSADYNSGLGPARSSVNLRLSKFFDLGPRQRVTFFLEGQNLLNHKNYRRVNPFTGDGYQLGDANPTWVDRWSTEEEPASTDSREYALGVVDPSYIEDPRTIMWGVSYSW